MKSKKLNKNKFRFVVIVAIIIGLFLLFLSFFNKSRQVKWKIYTNSKYRFSITYPPNMYIDLSFVYDSDKGITLKTINPTQKSIPKGGKGYLIFEPVINAHFFDTLSDNSLLGQIINQKNATYNGVPIIYKEITVANKPVYQFEYLGPENSKWISTLIVEDNNVYKIDFNSYEVTPEWRRIYNQVITSFRGIN